MSKKVLIICREAEDRIIYKKKLEDKLFTFFEASHGKEGLDLIERHPDIGLVLVDAIMPVMGGMTFLHKIQKMDTSAKAIVIADSTSLKQVTEFKEKGALCVLAKPIDLDLMAELFDDFAEVVAHRQIAA